MRSKRDFSKTETPKIGIKFNLITNEAIRNFFKAIFVFFASKIGGMWWFHYAKKFLLPTYHNFTHPFKGGCWSRPDLEKNFFFSKLADFWYSGVFGHEKSIGASPEFQKNFYDPLSGVMVKTCNMFSLFVETCYTW